MPLEVEFKMYIVDVLVEVLANVSTVELNADPAVVLVSDVEFEVTLKVPVVMERSKSKTRRHFEVPSPFSNHLYVFEMFSQSV